MKYTLTNSAYITPRQIYMRTIQWRNGLLPDALSSLGEALAVLAISSLSLMILSIQYGLNNADVKFIEAFLQTILSTLQPTEMIVYVTGILSTTTAYFLFRPKVVKRYFVRFTFVFLATFTIFYFATPLFISGLDTTPSNQGFATTLALILGTMAGVIWFFSLFTQRRLFENGSMRLKGDARAREIAKNIEKLSSK